MRKIAWMAFAASALLPACYHATVETGAAPSATVVEESFASSWVYGLVPPKTVEAASKCPNGVARVETQLSFVNQLVGALTFGIYTPMSIKVTCAAGAKTVGFTVPSGAGADRQAAIVTAAVERSVVSGAPVLVGFTK